MLVPMGANSFSDIKDSLRHLYLEDPRPWLVGFSGGKDSTMFASLKGQGQMANAKWQGLPRRVAAHGWRRRRIYLVTCFLSCSSGEPGS